MLRVARLLTWICAYLDFLFGGVVHQNELGLVNVYQNELDLVNVSRVRDSMGYIVSIVILAALEHL